jgi:glycopeptide antibiotics resistance protein
MSSRQRTGGNSASIQRELVLFSFVAYISAVFAITIAPTSLAGISEPAKSPVNFIPIIHSVNYYLGTYADPTGVSTEKALENIIGNLLLFIPLGILLPCISPKFKSLKSMIAASFICSMFIECCQFFLGYFGTYRTSDIDDVILNKVSGLIGWLISTRVFERYFSRSNYSVSYFMKR